MRPLGWTVSVGVKPRVPWCSIAARALSSRAGRSVKLAEAAPGSLWLHLAAGEANESEGQSEAAIREYKEVLSLQPNRSGVHYRIGRVLLARATQATGDTASEPEALKEFEQELQIDPTNANAAYEAGEIHRKSARFDRALELFSQAVKHYPDFEEALVALGRTLVSLRKAEEAIAPLRKALALNAANDVAWFQLAQAQRALGNAAEQQKALAEFGHGKDLRDLGIQAADDVARRAGRRLRGLRLLRERGRRYALLRDGG